MRWRGLSTSFAAISAMLMVNAVVLADEEKQTTEKDGHLDRSTSEPSAHARPRSVYKVDDIGMIIGGASEDAKAKVGRLPIRD